MFFTLDKLRHGVGGPYRYKTFLQHSAPCVHKSCLLRPVVVIKHPFAVRDPVHVEICDGAEEVHPQLQSGTALQQGPRETMEDFLTVTNASYGFLFSAVYDGHNGDSAARYLVQHLFQVFETLLQEEIADLTGETKIDGKVCYPIKLHDTLTDSFKRTDQALLNWMRDHADGDEANSGCTATIALVRADAVIVANVGDSRAVLCRSGQALDLSTQHRVYGRDDVVKSEISRVEEAGGWVDDGRVCGVLAVSRAFGDPEFKGSGLQHLLQRGVQEGMWSQEFASSRHFAADPVIVEPDVAVLRLDPSDEFLVLATDGLWDVLSSQDVINLARTNLKKGLSAQDVADKLSNIALKRYTADNVAVVVVCLKGNTTEGSNSSTEQPDKKRRKFGFF